VVSAVVPGQMIRTLVAGGLLSAALIVGVQFLEGAEGSRINGKADARVAARRRKSHQRLLRSIAQMEEKSRGQRQSERTG